VTAATESLDRQGPTSLHEQIAARLTAEIAAGKYETDRPVPSQPEIMERFGVAKVTAQKAQYQLASDRLVTIVQGRGAFVLPHAAERAADLMAASQR
jgi:GntR family transcriptional regulator